MPRCHRNQQSTGIRPRNWGPACIPVWGNTLQTFSINFRICSGCFGHSRTHLLGKFSPRLFLFERSIDGLRYLRSSKSWDRVFHSYWVLATKFADRSQKAVPLTLSLDLRWVCVNFFGRKESHSQLLSAVQLILLFYNSRSPFYVSGLEFLYFINNIGITCPMKITFSHSSSCSPC